MNKQIFFIDDDEDEHMDLATKLDTEPELVDRVYNRPRKGQLETMAPMTSDTSRAEHEKKKTQRELTQRMDRLKRLKRALKVLDKAVDKKNDKKVLFY